MRIILPQEERSLLDHLAVEHLSLSVSEVEIYISKVETQDQDVLYAEPIERWHYDMYRVLGYVRKPEITEDPREPGRVTERRGLLVVARKTLDDLGITLKVGDIVKFWGMYYDIVKVEPWGFKNDEAFFTHWQCELVRRTKYLPEVKVETQ